MGACQRSTYLRTPSERESRARGEGHLPEPEKGAAAEGVVTPLVGAGHECSDQAADDEDDAHEERRDDVRERETGRKQDLEEQQGEVDEPLDIPDILDSKGWYKIIPTKVLLPTYPNLPGWVATIATELDGHRCRTEVGCHREVGKTGGQKNNGRNLVEETGATGSLRSMNMVSVHLQPSK